MDNDPVNHPSHYTSGKIEVIDFIEDQKLTYCLGNTVKYIARAGKKDPTKLLEDLKKAAWYLNREIVGIAEDPALPQPAAAASISAFKVGDKVKYFGEDAPSWNLKRGDTGTVRSITGLGNSISVNIHRTSIKLLLNPVKLIRILDDEVIEEKPCP